MVRDVIISFMNLGGKPQTEDELKHYCNDVICWINNMNNEKKISDALHQLAITTVDSIKRKKSYF